LLRVGTVDGRGGTGAVARVGALVRLGEALLAGLTITAEAEPSACGSSTTRVPPPGGGGVAQPATASRIMRAAK
jgi:hypothetical protein